MSGRRLERVSGSSLGEELDGAARVLTAAGVRQARREVSSIWAHLTGATVGNAWVSRAEEVPPDVHVAFRRAVARRARGEPVAYAAELAGFRTLDVKVDRRVLIPRPETEGLIELVLAWGREEKGPRASWGVALDLGTGSGCVALSLAVEGRFRRVVATDVSADALAVARENLARVQPPVPVELRQGSLFQPVAGESYDVIVSNPPYVTEDEFARLDTGVRNFEPPEALVSGEDGLELTRCLVEHAGAHLAAGGLFALEVDSSRADTVLQLARVTGWRAARLEMDVFGRLRYLLATMESNQ